MTNDPRAAPLIGHVVPIRFLNSTMTTHTMNDGQTTDRIGAANATMAFKPRLQMAKDTRTVTMTPVRYEILPCVVRSKYDADAPVRPMAVVRHASPTMMPRMITPVLPSRCLVISTISVERSMPAPKASALEAPR